MTVTRRTVSVILGLIWFVDGLLQLKPVMFTNTFLNQVILPTAQNQPSWVAAIVTWGAHVTAPHIALLNLLFAFVQLALGIGFIFNVWPRITIGASVAWSLMVWVFGEGMGQLLTGQSFLISGAPGAVILYALVGISLWPSRGGGAEWTRFSMRFAQVASGVIWLIGCIMLLQPSALHEGAFAQSVSLSWLSAALGHSALATEIILAVVEGVLGILLIWGKQVHCAAWCSFVLAFVFWWVGQSFGEVFDPLATDLNSGPLLMLFTICAAPNAWFFSRVRKHEPSVY